MFVIRGKEFTLTDDQDREVTYATEDEAREMLKQLQPTFPFEQFEIKPA